MDRDQSFVGFDLAGLRVWALVRICFVVFASEELDFFPLDRLGPCPLALLAAEPTDAGLRSAEAFRETASLPGRSLMG